MTLRISFVLCATLVLARAASAQVSTEIPPATPPVIIQGTAPDVIAPNVEATAAVSPNSLSWLAADYLIGWVQSPKTPALVTTSPAGTARGSAGVIGRPGTDILFGGDRVTDSARSGIRLGAGTWFGGDRFWGLEGGLSFLESESAFFEGASDGSAILARPFMNAVTRNPQAVLVAFPGAASGALSARASSGAFSEFHIALTENLVDGRFLRLYSLLGYRFYRYGEGLRVGQILNPTDPTFVAGTQINTLDDFGTKNTFNGADLGLRARFYIEEFSLDLLGKVAVGSIHNIVNIGGGQIVSVPGVAPVAQNGGVLALPSNIGRHQQYTWATLPELGATFGWQVGSGLRLCLGYSALFLDSIASAGSQVDVSINPALFPPSTLPVAGPNRPRFEMTLGTVLIQTLNLGMEFTF